MNNAAPAGLLVLLGLSLLGSVLPATILGLIVYCFNPEAAYYTATAVFVWQFVRHLVFTRIYIVRQPDE